MRRTNAGDFGRAPGQTEHSSRHPARPAANSDNIGHTFNPGCFRCHDGAHKSSDGQVIPTACTTCHIIMSQGTHQDSRLISPEGLEFKHPVDIGDTWKQMPCTTCHNGTLP